MALSSRSIYPALAALSVAAGISAPGAARADGGKHSVSPGFTLSLSVGDKLAFGMGLDVRYTTLLISEFSGCVSRPRAGPGFFGQATWLNFSAGRFALGVHGGGELVDYVYAVDGELGWTYRTSYDDEHPGGHGVHLGLANLIRPGVELGLRGTIPWFGNKSKPELSIGLTGRLPGTFGMPTGQCIEGRPLRVGDGHATADIVACGPAPCDAEMDRLNAATRRALAEAWLFEARTECASIPAFLALARDLRAAGAPASLVQRALAAARDEANHTSLCLAPASACSGVELTAVVPEMPRANDRDRAAALRRLAVESWQDGLLGEGAAAARARRKLARAVDPRARRAQATIARDEQRHAELGRDVAAWCVAEGGRAVRDALAPVVLAPESPPPEVDSADEADRRAWSRHGRIDGGDVASTWAEAWREARAEGERLLAPRGMARARESSAA